MSMKLVILPTNKSVLLDSEMLYAEELILSYIVKNFNDF